LSLRSLMIFADNRVHPSELVAALALGVRGTGAQRGIK
jgi:hypothetical protein